MCISFWWSRRCPSLDFFWACVFILAICSLFRAFFTVVLACDFDIFARLSMLILAGSSALHICLCQWFLRFVAILFFIELSFSFRILCRYRICFSCIIVSTFPHSCLYLDYFTGGGTGNRGFQNSFECVTKYIFSNCSISAFIDIHASATYVIIKIIHISTNFQTTFISILKKLSLPARLNIV